MKTIYLAKVRSFDTRQHLNSVEIDAAYADLSQALERAKKLVDDYCSETDIVKWVSPRIARIYSQAYDKETGAKLDGMMHHAYTISISNLDFFE